MAGKWIAIILSVLAAIMVAGGCSSPHATHLSKSLVISVLDDPRTPPLTVSDLADCKIKQSAVNAYSIVLRLNKNDGESFYGLTSENVGKTAEISCGGETLFSARIMEPIRDGGLQFSFSDAALLKKFLELIGG